MRFDSPKSLNEILQEYLEKFPRKHQLKQGMILSVWEEVVGDRIASQSEDLHFEGTKLVVKVRNATWRHEIHANRFSIVKRLNAQVKSDVVTELIVRA